MLWFFGPALLLVLASFVTCSTPTNHTISPQAAASGHHVTLGLATRDDAGYPHIRHEVRDLYANYPDQWALYLLGLLRFQEVDQTDPLSYYRISGIHARPYELWQDAHGAAGEPVGAYCPHNNRLFLTWHRPYLALFEQELWQHVLIVADQAQTERDRWLAAANAFRIPYWDTARGVGDGGMPDFLLSPRWSVVGPNGIQLVDNPLFWYQFHPLVPEELGPSTISSYNQTMRWPTTQSSDARPQVNFLQARYIENQRARQDAVHNAFTWDSSFNEFSKSIEGAHAYVHIDTGGDGSNGHGYIGHMWNTDYSAFDPIFMLHHANIDRLMAMYQAANPNSWLQPEYVDGDKDASTFWIPKGATLDTNWPLPPFWRTEDTFHTSETVRWTYTFGHAYPETQFWKFATEQDYRNDVKGTIQKLYSSSVRATLTDAIANGGRLNDILDDDNTFIDWSIETTASAVEMPTSFTVEFSLIEDPPSNQTTRVGMWVRMTTADRKDNGWGDQQAAHEADVDKTKDKTMSNHQSLTSSLLDQIKDQKLRTLEPDAVVPYLKNHLAWNVYAGLEQERVSSDQLGNFTVKVTATTLRIPIDPSQPLQRIGDTTTYQITME